MRETSIPPLRAFASRVELLSPSGSHVRYVHAALARAMVESAGVEIGASNGRVKSVRLLASAATCARHDRSSNGRLGRNQILSLAAFGQRHAHHRASSAKLGLRVTRLLGREPELEAVVDVLRVDFVRWATFCPPWKPSGSNSGSTWASEM